MKYKVALGHAEDVIFREIGNRASRGWGTLIACIYADTALPDYCEQMPRAPLPQVGEALTPQFADTFEAALKVNPSVHDGAVMFQRGEDGGAYLTAWSFRLFPPSMLSCGIVNRGSAFNSCLAMSVVPTVERLYLISGAAVTAFAKGHHRTL